MSPAFLGLASVLVLATVLGIATKVLRQPLLLAYIFAGIIVSSLGVFGGFDRAILELLSNLGIAFLLLLVGVDLNFGDLKYVGRAAVYTGIGQIFFTGVVGYVIVSALGFSPIVAIYIALALTFSSTAIIIKLLYEKHDLQSLYGKIVVGYLLVQDFVAILALMFLSGFGNGQVPTAGTIAAILFKGLFLLGATYVGSKWILKWLFRLTSSSGELLFVSAIAWAFFLAALGELLGFSIAIGAFLAGVAIASSPYRIQISARVKPLRDFFIILFFIILGASISVGSANVVISHILILSLFIMIGKPLIVWAVMLSLKFRNRTSFMSSIAGAQISEFSLILVAQGVALGHVNIEAGSLVSSVGIVTITLSTYFILYADKLYKIVGKYLVKFFPERARDPYVIDREKLSDHVILVGCEQMGWDILEFLKTKYKNKQGILVVDFNPEIVKSLTASGYKAVFGDIADPEVLEELELSRARLIIITDPDIEDAAVLIKFAKSKNYTGPIIGTTYWLHDAIRLYEMGADYVVVPEDVGGKHLAKVLFENWEDLAKIKKAKSHHFDELLSRRIF